MAEENEKSAYGPDQGKADLSDERVVEKLKGWANSSGWTRDVAQKALAGEVVNQQALTRLTKPSSREFAEAAGIDPIRDKEKYQELASIYSTGVFNQRDIRDWNKIMKSKDPLKAARIATRQVVDSGAYDKNPKDKGREEFPSSTYSSVTPAPEGQMGIASVNRPTGRGRDNYQDQLMTPSGRRLTQIVDAGGDDVTRQRQLDRFGYNLTQSEINAESFLNPFMEQDLYYGIDWLPPEAQEETIKKFTPVRLVSPQGFDVTAFSEQELKNYLSMGYKRVQNFSEGGAAMNRQMEMAFMQEGGLRDDGMDQDPVSGNEVPSGSMAQEVRDDIPAQLSEGEYVVPADVVRFFGVKFFEDLRTEAKRGLADMEANGRIGGEPVPAGGPTNEEDLSPEEMQALQEIMSGMAEGGTVQNPYLQQQQLYRQPAPQAVGNSMGYAPGGDVTSGDTEQNILQQGEEYKPFSSQDWSLGSSFMSSGTSGLGSTFADATPGEQTEVKLWSKEGVGPSIYYSPRDDETIKMLEAQGYTRTPPEVKSATSDNDDGGPTGTETEEEDTNISALQGIDWSDQDAVLAWGKDQSSTILDKGLIGGAMAATSISNIRAAAIVARAKYGDDSPVAKELDAMAQKKEDDLGPIGKLLGKVFGFDGTKKAQTYFEQQQETETSTGTGTGTGGMGPPRTTIKPKLRPDDDGGSPTVGSTPPAASQPTATTGGGMTGTGSDTRPDDPRGEGQYGGQSTSGSTSYSSSSGSVNTSAKDADMGVGGNPNAGSVASSSVPDGFAEDADYGALYQGGLMATPKRKRKNNKKK